MRLVLLRPLVAVAALWPLLGCAQTPRTPSPPLPIPTQSQAASAQRDVREQVQEVLGRRGDASSLREAGAPAVALLEQVLNSGAEPQPRRVRAVEVLGVLEVPEAGERLKALLRQERTAGFLRAAAAVAVAQRFGAESFEALKAMLEDPAPDVRVGGARAMVVIATLEARAALEHQVSREPEREVREALQRNLSRMNP